MLKTWLDFGGILLETDFLANFLWKVWMCFFKVKHSLYWTYLRNGWYDWCETKRSCIGWILGELCDLDHWPHPWPWPLIFQGQILKDLYLRNCYLIDVKQKESKSIRYRGDCMVLPFDHTHELDLVISRSKFEVALFEEWESWLTWNERDVSWSFMTMTDLWVTMVEWVYVLDSDWGDFKRRRVVDISSLSWFGQLSGIFKLMRLINVKFIAFHHEFCGKYSALSQEKTGMILIISHWPPDYALNTCYRAAISWWL